MRRQYLVRFTLPLVSLFVLIFTLVATARLCFAAEKPNFLIIIADDCTYNDLPIYGGRNVKTPHIDRLASQGMVFDWAFVSIAMCNPCRTELYTGLYPARNGSCWNHSAARPGVRSIVHYLQDLGYRVAIAGKVHVGPRKCFPFEYIEGLEPNCVSPTVRFEPAGLLEFMKRDPTQPFCLIVALVVPHIPWTVGDPSHFDPEKVILPPNIADTKETREAFVKYLAEIEMLDQQVGTVLELLERSGSAHDTLVMFTSEQGSQFPGNKWTNYNTGVHTAFIVRWPGKVKPGVRASAMIQYCDVLPTLIEIAGGDPSVGRFDGRSFLPVLLGKKKEHRRYVFFMHNNIPEGPPYPIRAVSDGRYHYIRNLLPQNVYIEKHMMGRGECVEYWCSWLFEATFDERTYFLANRYLHRPVEELYLIAEDPFELNNLANIPDHRPALERLSKELDRWMAQQHDPGAAIDTVKQWQASKKGMHFPLE